MDCRKIKELIDNGEGNNNSSVKDHIEKCEECRRYFSASLYIKELFEKHSPEMDDPDPEAFDMVLFRKLSNVSEPENISAGKWFFRPVFSFSIAAIIFIAIGLSLFFSSEKISEKPQPEPDSMFTAQINEPVGIVIEYESDEELKDVSVRFVLDRGVRFHSEKDSVKELDTFIWKGSFSKGKNEIPFVVDIVEPGKWEIMTVAEFSGYIHNHRITLDASSEIAVVRIFRYKPEKIRKKT